MHLHACYACTMCSQDDQPSKPADGRTRLSSSRLEPVPSHPSQWLFPGEPGRLHSLHRFPNCRYAHPSRCRPSPLCHLYHVLLAPPSAAKATRRGQRRSNARLSVGAWRAPSTDNDLHALPAVHGTRPQVNTSRCYGQQLLEACKPLHMLHASQSARMHADEHHHQL